MAEQGLKEKGDVFTQFLYNATQPVMKIQKSPSFWSYLEDQLLIEKLIGGKELDGHPL